MKLHHRAPILHCSNRQVVRQSLPEICRWNISWRCCWDFVGRISTYITSVCINPPSTQHSVSDRCWMHPAWFVTYKRKWGLQMTQRIGGWCLNETVSVWYITFCRSFDFPYCPNPWNFIPHPVAMTCWPIDGATVGQQIELIVGDLVRSIPCFSLSNATSLSK